MPDDHPTRHEAALPKLLMNLSQQRYVLFYGQAPHIAQNGFARSRPGAAFR